MKRCILRQVIYKLPETDTLRWGIVLCQQGGLTLLFVPRCDEEGSHNLAICTENTEERLFENVETSQFPLEDENLCSIGNKLLALGECVAEEEVNNILEDLL